MIQITSKDGSYLMDRMWLGNKNCLSHVFTKLKGFLPEVSKKN